MIYDILLRSLPYPAAGAYQEKEVHCDIESSKHEDCDGSVDGVLSYEMEAALEVLQGGLSDPLPVVVSVQAVLAQTVQSSLHNDRMSHLQCRQEGQGVGVSGLPVEHDDDRGHREEGEEEAEAGDQPREADQHHEPADHNVPRCFWFVLPRPAWSLASSSLQVRTDWPVPHPPVCEDETRINVIGVVC